MAKQSGGEAKRVIEEFWRIRDEGDYTKLAPLFAEDAVLEDPIWGTHKGRDAANKRLLDRVDGMGRTKV